MDLSERAHIRLNSVDIEWDLHRGDLSFYGLDSVLFWTNPSMYRLLCPLVEELGVELFRLLVAHGSSLGTDADYDLMVTKLGRDFVSGFLAWGDAVATAGWGRFEVLAYEPDAGTALVRVHHPWELKMQQGSAVRWGCPFIQGKIIGLFSHAFRRSCWADESLHTEDEARPYLDLRVHPSHRRLGEELEVLRRERMAARVHKEKLASLGALTAGIAHELKNPLNFVNNFAATTVEMVDELAAALADGATEDVQSLLADIKECVGKIHEHGNRADQVIVSMLMHARESAVERTPADLNHILASSLNLAYHSMRAKDPGFSVTLATNYSATPLVAEVAVPDIGRVLINVLENAWYALRQRRDGGEPNYQATLTVETRALATRHELRIRDNGVGIPGDLTEKVFSPFFTTKPPGHGTGLGLSISHDIVHAHRGDIRIESVEGVGTDVIITLQRVDDTPAP